MSNPFYPIIGDFNAINVGGTLILDAGQTLICRLTYTTVPANDSYRDYYEITWTDKKPGEADSAGSTSGYIQHQAITELIAPPAAGWRRYVTAVTITHPAAPYGIAPYYFLMERTGFSFKFPELDIYVPGAEQANWPIVKWTEASGEWRSWNRAETQSWIIGALKDLVPGTYCTVLGPVEAWYHNGSDDYPIDNVQWPPPPLGSDDIEFGSDPKQLFYVRNFLARIQYGYWINGYSPNKMARVLAYVPGARTATVQMCDPIYNLISARTNYPTANYATMTRHDPAWVSYWTGGAQPSNIPYLPSALLYDNRGNDHFSFFKTNEWPSWQSSTAYKYGDIVNTPTSVSAATNVAMRVLRCTVAGTTGATQPNWASGSGPWTDGDVTWTLETNGTNMNAASGASVLFRRTCPGTIYGMGAIYATHGNGYTYQSNNELIGGGGSRYVRSWIGLGMQTVYADNGFSTIQSNKTYTHNGFNNWIYGTAQINDTSLDMFSDPLFLDKPACFLEGTITNDDLEHPDWEAFPDTLTTATTKFTSLSGVGVPPIWDKYNNRWLALVDQHCDPRDDYVISPAGWNFADGATRRAFTPTYPGDQNRVGKDLDTGLFWQAYTSDGGTTWFWYPPNVQTNYGTYGSGANAIYESRDGMRTWQLVYDAAAAYPGYDSPDTTYGNYIRHFEVNEKGWSAVFVAYDPNELTNTYYTGFTYHKQWLITIVADHDDNVTAEQVYESPTLNYSIVGESAWCRCFTWSNTMQKYYIGIVKETSYATCYAGGGGYPQPSCGSGPPAECATPYDTSQYFGGPPYCQNPSCHCETWCWGPNPEDCFTECYWTCYWWNRWPSSPNSYRSAWNAWTDDDGGSWTTFTDPIAGSHVAYGIVGVCDTPPDWGMSDSVIFAWCLFYPYMEYPGTTKLYTYMVRNGNLVDPRQTGVGEYIDWNSWLFYSYNYLWKFDNATIAYGQRSAYYTDGYGGTSPLPIYLASSDNIGRMSSYNTRWSSTKSYGCNIPLSLWGSAGNVNQWSRFL